jgi:hypothetical protein
LVIYKNSAEMHGQQNIKKNTQTSAGVNWQEENH